MQPRLIRLRDAPTYLGMDINRFNKEVRPCLTEIKIGIQGIAFDRLDLDRWVDHYKQCNGRPAVRSAIWDANSENQLCQDSSKEMGSGGWKKWSTAKELEKVVALATMKKPNVI